MIRAFQREPRPDFVALVLERSKRVEAQVVACLDGLGIRVVQPPSGVRAAAFLGEVDLVIADVAAAATLVRSQPTPAPVCFVLHDPEEVERALMVSDRLGAVAVCKPLRTRPFRQLVERALHESALRLRVTALESRLARLRPSAPDEPRSPVMRECLALVDEHAFSAASVLLVGERGTGKLELALHLHQSGGRCDRAFEVIDCAALKARRGGNAEITKAAWRARRGTLCLRRVEALGDDAAMLFDDLPRAGEGGPRLVAATSDAQVAGAMAHWMAVEVPPLRRRHEDVLPLARLFLSGAAPLASFDHSAEELLEKYPWPGNVAELRNVVEAASFEGRRAVSAAALPRRLRGRADDLPYVGGPFSLEQIEEAHLAMVLETAEKLEDAAGLLGIDLSTLWRKRQRMGDKHKEH